MVQFKCLNPFTMSLHNLSYPTETCYTTVATNLVDDLVDDEVTVLTSNRTQRSQSACHLAGLLLAGGHTTTSLPLSIADSGATQIFVMDGTPVVN